MKKIVNVILVIVLLISIGFNIYFYSEIKRVTKIDNDRIEEIAKLGNELDKSKETLNSKDIEITELKTQISSKEEKIKGIQESLLSLESEKEKLIEQIEGSKIVEVKEIKGNSQTGCETQANANVPDEPPTTSLEDFCNQFDLEPPIDSNTKNPNSTGGSNGAIQWGN